MAHGTRYTEEELEALATRYAESSPEPTESTVIETERTDRTAVLSVRLPIAVVAMLKSAAEDEGVGATVLARDFIIAGLTERGGLSDVSVSVVDLMSFALAKARTNSPAREGSPDKRATVTELAPSKRARQSSAKAAATKSAVTSELAKSPEKAAQGEAAATATPRKVATKAASSKAAGSTRSGSARKRSL